MAGVGRNLIVASKVEAHPSREAVSACHLLAGNQAADYWAARATAAAERLRRGEAAVQHVKACEEKAAEAAPRGVPHCACRCPHH